jgi:hypothetical protein
MQQVQIADLAWLTTFPHRVMPQDDEWLAGLLLRCDEANHWECRTTLAHFFRSSKGKPLNGTLDFVLVASWMLEALEQRLMIPRRMLLATTYHAELARLYATGSPHVSQLNRAFPFAVRF